MQDLEKAMQSLTKALQSVSNKTTSIVETLAQFSKEYNMSPDQVTLMINKIGEKQMDGHVGSYKGHEIYYIDPDNYFANKKANDAQDVYWLMTDTDILVHRGKTIGKVNGKQVESIKQVDIFAHYPEYREEARKNERAQMLAAMDEAVKRGNTGVKKVTERRSVEWYVQHTIDALNEGVHYGERRLEEVSRIHGK